MNEHQMRHSQLIEELSSLHEQSDELLNKFLAVNGRIAIIEQELSEIQKPKQDWE